MALPHEIDADVYLTYNGSYCFHGKETIFSNPIPNKDVKTIIENASSINRPVLIATKDRMIANGKDEDLVEYTSFAHLDVIVSDDFDHVVDTGKIYQVMSGCREKRLPDSDEWRSPCAHYRLVGQSCGYYSGKQRERCRSK